MATISLEALVDKKTNKVVFVEADEDFLDVLFSFLIMPIGTIIKLTDKHPPTSSDIKLTVEHPPTSSDVKPSVKHLPTSSDMKLTVEHPPTSSDIKLTVEHPPTSSDIKLTVEHPPTSSVGCMNNLYTSVEKLDVKYFCTELCKTMLLLPRNAAGDEYKKFTLEIDSSNQSRYFLCHKRGCTTSGHKLVSFYKNAVCYCGEKMEDNIPFYEGKHDLGGVYAKQLVRQLVTDDLRLLRASTTPSSGIPSGVGVMNYDDLEERTFDIREKDVLDLLKYSFISNTPLTNVLLKTKASPIVPNPRKDDNIKSKHPGCQIKEERVSTECKNVSIKLVISKSDKKVCYAEVGEDFVDLVFSFLTIPLGYVLKEMSNEPSKGCPNQLYESVRHIDAEKYMKSVAIKNLLLSPKIAPCHGYPNHPLGLEEAKQQLYYHMYTSKGVEEMLTTDAQIVPSGCTSKGVALSLKDPKSPPQKDTSIGGGYVRGPAKFTVSDDLVIVPISPVSALNILKGMKVPFCHVEERDVSVGKEEALRLLLAAFSSDSALTHAFLRRQAN